MQIIPFGTNGFFSSFGRQTACYVIPYGKTLIILDAGSGLFRFAEDFGKKLLNGVNDIHLYLSHYHLDHTFGFYAAFKLFKNKKVTVFARDEKQVFWEFVKMRHFPVDYAKVHKNFSWSAIREGKQKVSSYNVFVRKQNHRGEVSLGYRFDFGVAYVTDGEPTREIIEFARDIPLLLHEHKTAGVNAIGKKLESHITDGHVTTVGAALVAKGANVGKLVLIHHDPFADNRRLENQLKIASSIFSKTYLAFDLESIKF